MKFGSKQNQELDKPPGAKSSKAQELARIWNVGDEIVQVTVNPGPYRDPAAWDLIIADLTQHVAAAYKQSNPHIPDDYILNRIVSGLRAELDLKTTEIELLGESEPGK